MVQSNDRLPSPTPAYQPQSCSGRRTSCFHPVLMRSAEGRGPVPATLVEPSLPRPISRKRALHGLFGPLDRTTRINASRWFSPLASHVSFIPGIDVSFTPGIRCVTSLSPSTTERDSWMYDLTTGWGSVQPKGLQQAVSRGTDSLALVITYWRTSKGPPHG
jgi:hypothetical protein